MDAEVVVVGAGLAGLRCAVALESAGHDVLVLEAADAVGGRVRTDTVDGHLCDRGFQVLNPAYPAVRAWVDVTRLDLHPFAAGVLVRQGDGRRMVIADPRREPRHAWGTLTSGYLTPRDVAALVRWITPALVAPRSVVASPDTTLAESFDAVGLTGRLRTEVLDTFLAGVLVDPTGESSANFARLLARMFVLGRPGLPARGMQALPELLAAGLRRGVRLGARVSGVDGDDGTVNLEGGEVLRARAIVVAADPGGAARLTGQVAPRMGGLSTWWFSAAQAPSPWPMLAVDAQRSDPGAGGPVWHAAVVSNAAPGYAPPGRHLIEATTLAGGAGSAGGSPSAGATESAVRAHLGRIYGAESAEWDLLIRHDVPEAVPLTRPPLRARSPLRAGERLVVCGDHRDTPSIQGALVSGNRAANVVRRVLGSA
jgi:phytoene dehydrogenase-like protein